MALVRSALAVVALALAGVGWGGFAPGVAVLERSCAGEVRSVGDERGAYAARARGDVVALARPGGRRLHAFGPLNVNGVETVFGVLAVVRGGDCRPAWYRVQLPLRPNGATGYVRAEAVELVRVRTRLEIDLSERRVDFYRDGQLVLSATGAIGSEATPTPTGRFYVNQRLRSGDPGGPFGPGAVGISAFSPVLTGWVQGGPIAVHGTNRPDLTGLAVSNGCVRVENETARRLLYETDTGAPVVIQE